MKKMGYMISLLFYIAVLMNCAGQTCCIEPEYFMQSVLLSGNFQTIEYQAVPNGNQIGLPGRWFSENAETAVTSRINFNTNGAFWENVYGTLNNQLLASYGGQYTTDENMLTLILNNGDRHRFGYRVMNSRLILTASSAEIETEKQKN